MNTEGSWDPRAIYFRDTAAENCVMLEVIWMQPGHGEQQDAQTWNMLDS